ncbi:MAG: 50S ribosomal protein L13 [uncultured bacterium]|nr:MAG: 50S ribosomal protein L13 [uncultured bacterium]
MSKQELNNNQTHITHKINLTGKILGRVSCEVANLLRGKNKVNFAYNLTMGDKVVVYNLDKIVLTGNKKDQKMYQSHSGYPGHLKSLTFQQVWEKDPKLVFIQSVEGMLPKNRLRKIWLKNLSIYIKEINE